MKKAYKILIAVLILLSVAFCIYILAFKPFKKVTFSSISQMLCEAVGIEAEDPSEEILKLSAVSKNIEARGEEKLTNEEAYSIISRMYLLASENENPLEKVGDRDDISKAYKKDVAGLIRNGYLENGKNIRPKAKANAKDIKNLILSIRGTDVTESGSCYEKIGEGNLSVKSEGVVLKNTVFQGDIIVCDTPSASLSLSKVTIKGRLIIRAASNTSVSLSEGTEITGGVYIVSAGGEATVNCSEDVFCEITSNGAARLKGNISSVALLDDADVKTEGNVGLIKTKGAGAISLENGSFNVIYAESAGANVRIGESVHGEKILVQKAFNGSTLNVSGNVEAISCSSKNSVINIKGTAVLGTLDIMGNSDNTNVLIEKRAKIEKLNNTENSKAAVIDNRSQWDGRR